ncbi:MAG TPA: hypothetical protein V6C69_19825 [Trichormus sp.]|jgi:hypothetical protein
MQSELVSVGIQAYQSHDYATAIEVLEKADRNEWLGQLYLAMSYYLTDRSDDSQRVFYRIKSECPDHDIRAKAESAFAAVRLKMRQIAEAEREKAEREKKEDQLDFH